MKVKILQLEVCLSKSLAWDCEEGQCVNPAEVHWRKGRLAARETQNKFVMDTIPENGNPIFSIDRYCPYSVFYLALDTAAR